MPRCLLAGAAIGVALAGCGGGGGSAKPPSSSGGSSPGRGGRAVACTEIGCDSGLSLGLKPIAVRLPHARNVRACLQDRCRSFSPTERLATVIDRRIKSERAVTVTVTATDAAGKVILRERRRAQTRRTQPNGPQCPPVCFQVALRLDGRARLVRAGAD